MMMGGMRPNLRLFTRNRYAMPLALSAWFAGAAALCLVGATALAVLRHPRLSRAGRTVAWIGDSNNMCNTWLQAATLLRIASPLAPAAGDTLATAAAIVWTARLTDMKGKVERRGASARSAPRPPSTR